MKRMDDERSDAVAKILDIGIETQPVRSDWYQLQQIDLPAPPRATAHRSTAQARKIVSMQATSTVAR